MHRTGSLLVTAATLPLAIGLAVDIHVVMSKIADSAAAGLVSGGAALVLLFGLWYGYPLAVAARGGRRRDAAKPQGQSG